MTKTIAGIDGGGTKTAFVLAREDGTVLRQLVRGASNPFDLGFEKAGEVLHEGLSALCENAPDGLFAGLSGGSSGDSSERLYAMLRTLYPQTPLDVSSDMVNAIASESLSGDGCAVIAGTGSSAFARLNGVLTRCGGWGYLFDGAGSGYDLGAGAIMHALRVRDGRAEASPLSEYLEEALGGSPTALLTDIYAKGKRYIASFAPVVFRAYDVQDPTAVQLLERTADYLAEIVSTVRTRAGLTEPAVVCIGGLWTRRDVLPVMAGARLPGLTLTFPSLPPVFGAVCEAARLAGIPVTENFRARFRQSFNG